MIDQSLEMAIYPKVAVRLSGNGGQGLLLAGRVLAEAAAIFNGLNVAQTNSYGPEARGGASRSEVVISPGPVDDIRCSRFDILVGLSQKACDAYYSSLKDHGLVIVDSTNVSVVPTSRAIEVPMTMMAVEECGNVMVTNMIALGVLCGYSDLVSFDSLSSAIKSTLRANLVPLNLKAIELGYNAARAIIGAMPEKRRQLITKYGFSRVPIESAVNQVKHHRTSKARVAVLDKVRSE